MFKKYRLSLIFSSMIFLIAFVLFYYMDLQSLTVWTLNIWDTLAETGNIRVFYEYSAMNLYRLEHAMVGSDILIYFPWAVWNLPIWMMQRFAGLNAIDHFWMMLYSKLFLAAVFAVVLFLAHKIAKLLSAAKEDTDRMLFLSATSFFTVTSLAYSGQNDVLVIAPFLAGIYELLRGKRIRFLLWAAVSIAFKPFFIFSFLAIILFLEKNLLKDVLYLGVGFSLYVLQKVLFIGAPSYAESLSYGPTKEAFGLMVQAKLDIPPAGASLFFLGIGVIWLMAYFCPAGLELNNEDSAVSKKKKSAQAYILYFATAPMVIFFLFTRYEAYRPFYLVPLLFLLMLLKPDYARLNILLETAATGALICFYLMDDILFYNPNYLLHFKNSVHAPSFSTILAEKLPGFGYAAFTAVFVLAMLFILVINHPAFHSDNTVMKQKEEPWLLPARSILYGLPLLIALLLRKIY